MPYIYKYHKKTYSRIFHKSTKTMTKLIQYIFQYVARKV